MAVTPGISVNCTGADVGVRHEPRQFIGRRPATIGAAGPDLAQVALRGAVVIQERPESHVYERCHRNDGQRNQKKLDSESGRGDQRVSRRVFALDKFLHFIGIWAAHPGIGREVP